MRVTRVVVIGVSALVTGLLLTGVAAADPVSLRAIPHGDAVLVEDVSIAVPGQSPISAYVVRPARPAPPHSRAGVLFLHWFEPGQVTQNRTEFLGEATELAGRGVVSVLPQLGFPWGGDPVGDAGDRAAVLAQLDAVRHAYGALLEQPGVDAGRTAVVGHDYGSMYAAILAQQDQRIRAEVFMAGDATWANWFDLYWLGLPDDQKAGYRALFSGLDPVQNLSRLGDRILFQWGDRDPFIPAPTRDAFAAADPGATATVYPHSDHVLTQAAKDDRAAFLSLQLGL